MIDIDLAQVTRIKPVKFYVDMVIDQQTLRMEHLAMNLESLSAQLVFSAAAAIPRISGWNIYDENGIMLVSVSAMDFYAKLGEVTPLKTVPADKKAAGWRPIPVVSPTTEEFQQSIQKAKGEGRLPK